MTQDKNSDINCSVRNYRKSSTYDHDWFRESSHNSIYAIIPVLYEVVCYICFTVKSKVNKQRIGGYILKPPQTFLASLWR